MLACDSPDTKRMWPLPCLEHHLIYTRMLLTCYLYPGIIIAIYNCEHTAVTDTPTYTYTSFDGDRRIASGSLQANALVVKRALESGATGPVLIFDDVTGHSIDIDTMGSDADVVARLATSVATDEPAAQVSAEATADEPRSRGRPKLGVVAREITLLPRHWEWLATQPGGASVALRKLVEAARRAHVDKDKTRKAHERAYHFMSAMAGDLPGFEEATRALFASDRAKFSTLIATWPNDVRGHALVLAFGDDAQLVFQPT